MLSFTHLTGEENCDAGRVTEYPELIYKKYCEFSKIYLIADNAEYFHAEKVGNRTDEHKKSDTVFLPGYAPNLNLTERFRRFAEKKPVKKQIL